MVSKSPGPFGVGGSFASGGARYPRPYSNSISAVSLDHDGTFRSGPPHSFTFIPSGSISAHRA